MQNASSGDTQADRDAMDRDLEALFGRRKPRQPEYVDDSDDRESDFLHSSLAPPRHASPQLRRPRKATHPRAPLPKASITIDVDSSSSDPASPPPKRKRLTSARPIEITSSDSSDHASGSRSRSPSPRNRSRPPTETQPKLAGKKKKALGMMMPAVFMKRAQADLKLMEQEKLQGYSEESEEMNSGDENGSGDESDAKGKGRANIRRVPRLLDEPIEFTGDAFTDESGEDENIVRELSSEDEDEAVTSWLSSFAPKKGRKAPAGGDDIIDRFLRRAKGGAGKENGNATGGSSRRRAKKSKHPQGLTATEANRHRKRPPQRNPNAPPLLPIADAHINRNAIGHARKTSVTHPPKHDIPLDTDAAIFGFSSTSKKSLPRAKTPQIVPPAQHIPTIPKVKEADDDNESWASFGRFSHDFEIKLFPLGITFPPTALLSTGHLESLLSDRPLPLPASPSRQITTFGIVLDSTSSPDDIASLVPQLCDFIFDTMSENSVERASPEEETDEPLRFVGNYVSEVLPQVQDAGVRSRFAATVTSQFDRLGTRLDSLESALDAEGPNRPFKAKRLLLSWYFIDIALRLGRIGAAGDGEESTLESCRLLIRRLVEFGAEHTTKSLKQLMVVVEEGGVTVVKDISVEVWICLISLALSERVRSFQEEDFWRLVQGEIVESLSLTVAASRGPIGGEVLSYSAMMICAISQFDISGRTTASARLSACWNIVARALEPIQPELLSKSDHLVSNTALARRDRYLWTLFARSLVFADRWGWRIDSKDLILPKLFEILNSRSLADLSIESNGDFPAFVQEQQVNIDTSLDRENDTAFVIFLKLLVKTADSIEAASDADRRRQLTKLCLRLSPMRSRPWTRNSVELTKSNSILINHYSLCLTFALLSPNSASQRLDQAQHLISFPDVNEEARRNCIRSILYFGLIYRANGLDITPITNWLATIAVQLRTEYLELEKGRKQEELALAKGKGTFGRQPDKNPMWHRVVLLTMVLRSVQLVAKASAGAIRGFPSIDLVHSAWTDELLNSPLSLDPMLGLEVIKAINCFLSIRATALAPPLALLPVDPGVGNSQDEFGMFDFDYEDPALNAMLGVEAAADVVLSENRVQDKALAEIVKTRLAPALYRLISNVFVTTASKSRVGPTITDRIGYAEELVECWTGCLTVLVENDLVDFTPYLRYGNECWKRISDPLGRRDIGLFFSLQVLKYDATVFASYPDEFLEVWFQSIVARNLTVQHAFTSLLLNLDKPSPLLDNLPFSRNITTGVFDISLDFIGKSRVVVLEAVFRNVAKFLLPPALPPSNAVFLPINPEARKLPKGVILNFIRCMLSSLKDNIQVITEASVRKSYVAFCGEVLDRLKFCPSETVNERALPDLKLLHGLVKGG